MCKRFDNYHVCTNSGTVVYLTTKVRKCNSWNNKGRRNMLCAIFLRKMCAIFLRCEKHKGKANLKNLILTISSNIYILSPFPPIWVNILLSWWWESRVLTKFVGRVNIVASRRLCDDSTCAHNQRQITSKLKQVSGTVDLKGSHPLPNQLFFYPLCKEIYVVDFYSSRGFFTI